MFGWSLTTIRMLIFLPCTSTCQSIFIFKNIQNHVAHQVIIENIKIIKPSQNMNYNPCKWSPSQSHLSIKFQFETFRCLFIHDWRLSEYLTVSKGGLIPTGKLMVFKLISSNIDDIFVKGPYVLPLWSVNVTDLMWWFSSSLTKTPQVVSTPKNESTTNWPCIRNKIKHI